MTGCFVVLFLFFDSPPSPPGKAASELTWFGRLFFIWMARHSQHHLKTPVDWKLEIELSTFLTAADDAGLTQSLCN